MIIRVSRNKADLALVFKHPASVLKFRPWLAVAIENQSELLGRIHPQRDAFTLRNKTVVDEKLIALADIDGRVCSPQCSAEQGSRSNPECRKTIRAMKQERRRLLQAVKRLRWLV